MPRSTSRRPVEVQPSWASIHQVHQRLTRLEAWSHAPRPVLHPLWLVVILGWLTMLTAWVIVRG